MKFTEEHLSKKALKAATKALWLEGYVMHRDAQKAALTVALALLNGWPDGEMHKVLTTRENGEGYDLKPVGVLLPLESSDAKSV